MPKPIEVLFQSYNWENTNQAVGNHSLTFRGDSGEENNNEFTAHLELTNATLRVYVSNKTRPGKDGWIDLTSYFSATAINSDRMLVLTSDLKVKWWKLVVTTSNATNKFNVYLKR